MSIYKRGKIYWTCFYRNGVKHQESLKTTKRPDALNKELKLRMEAERGQLPNIAADFGRLTFAAAIKIYLDDRGRVTSPETGKVLA